METRAIWIQKKEAWIQRAQKYDAMANDALESEDYSSADLWAKKAAACRYLADLTHDTVYNDGPAPDEWEPD